MQVNWILVKFWKGKAKIYQCNLGDYWKITRLRLDYTFWLKQLIWPVLGVQACSGEWVKQKVDKKSKKKTRKRKKDRGTKKGQRRKDEKERRKRRTGRACFLLLRLPFCAVLSASRDAAILANQWPIKILKQVGTPAHPDYRIRRLGGVCGGDRPRKLIIFAPMCASLWPKNKAADL